MIVVVSEERINFVHGGEMVKSAGRKDVGGNGSSPELCERVLPEKVSPGLPQSWVDPVKDEVT